MSYRKALNEKTHLTSFSQYGVNPGVCITYAIQAQPAGRGSIVTNGADALTVVIA